MKYNDIKKNYTVTHTEAKELKKCSITKIIEQYYIMGEKLPEAIINNINFLDGVFNEYYIKSENRHLHINEKQTVAQNIMESLNLEQYKSYINLDWLKTYDDDANKVIFSLICGQKYDVIHYFLDLIEKEDKTKKYNKEVFECIFNMNQHLEVMFANENYVELVTKYLKLFQRSLEVYEPFYQESCKKQHIVAKDVKNWHKEQEHLYMLHKGIKLHKVNIWLLKNDNFLCFIKDIFAQYDSPEENLFLSKEYFDEAIKNGSEKIVMFYISEFLTHNILTQEQIEEQINKSLHNKILEMSNEISSSFRNEYKNDYSNTYNLDKVYDIVIKYGNYQPDYEALSELLLIDNIEFQEKFVSKILKTEKVRLNNISVNQWKVLLEMVEMAKQITGKGFEPSYKQRQAKYPKEFESFVKENPYEIVYRMNRINTLFNEPVKPLSEELMQEVYELFKKEIACKLDGSNFNADNFILNNRLQRKLSAKNKIRGAKI